MIVYLIYFILFLCSLHVAFNYNKRARLLRKIPGFKDRFIVGNALELMLSPVDLFELPRRYARNCKKIFRFWSYPFGAVAIYDPEDIEKVLSGMKHNEKGIIYRILKPWLQDGLLLSKETSMGTKLSEETSSTGLTYKNALYELGKKFVERFTRVHYNIDFIFALSSIGRKQKQYLEIVHNFTKRVIKDRREYIETFGVDINENNVSDEDTFFMKRKKTAMLDLLISAQNKGLIDHNGVQEEVDTFMFEGHDTTAAGLAFCLMSLANDRQIQEKIYVELDGIFGNSTRPSTMDDLSRMNYLECCIKESLRLYPPVHFIARKLGETLTLSNYVVEEGTYIMVLIYDMHRREDLYKDALKFDPDRFLLENTLGRHPYAYIPFSAGPRNCIGQKFAMLEMKSALSAVLRRYRLEPVTHHADIEITADVVLRTSHPILVKFIKRDV